MSDYLPIVVAAPRSARDRLRSSGMLPQHLFRDIAGEQLWEEHPSPSIYLWPYDIPYANSNELREKIVERVGDVPAFFGMDPKEAKDHQERMLSRILFGSVVVHILFLDNRKNDTSRGYEERNETYAHFCTFGEIVEWSRNLKQVLDVRFLNNNSKSHHILVLISCGQQVTASQKDIDALSELIGSSNSREYKPFRSCYFLDMNLVPGKTGKIFHSKYIWDVLVSRFLLVLLLSQEKIDKRQSPFQKSNGNSAQPKPLWEKNPGIKVWRASDCAISVRRDSSQAILKKALENAARKLQEMVCEDSEGKRLSLVTNDGSVDRNSLDYQLAPRWLSGEPEFKKWIPKKNAKWSFSTLGSSFFCNWSDLQVSEYEKEIESPEHWSDSFAKLRQASASWRKKQPPADYTSSVEDFFFNVRKKPGELGFFIGRLFEKITATHAELRKENQSDSWAEIVKKEIDRRKVLRQLEEDSTEFDKAQRYYIGRGIASLVVVAVTALSGWMIWQVLGLFGVSFLKILLLSGMVFAGSAVAYIVVMLLHNFAGNRAAGTIMDECRKADRMMLERDNLVRKMFFAVLEKRNILTLQCVRFRTWLLAKRVQAILETELQPQLSKLLKVQEDAGSTAGEATEEFPDPDHVRDNYLRVTRASVGPLQIGNLDEKKLKEKEAEGVGSFLALWKELCSEDRAQAGYFPARLFISRIRSFVTGFLEDIHHFIFEESIQSSKDRIKEAFQEYVNKVHSLNDEESLLSAPLPSYSGNKTKLLFINSSFFELLPEGVIVKSLDGEYSSMLLETTRTAALFYQEFDVDFDLKPIPGSEKTDLQQLTFKVRVKKGVAP